MDKKTSIALLVFVVILFGIVFFYPTGNKSSDIDNRVENNKPKESVSFGEIKFSTVNDFELATTFEQISDKSYIPPCEEKFDYCLYYVGDLYKGTNFESAGLMIKTRNDLKTKESCLSSQPDGYRGLIPDFFEGDNYFTSVFKSLGDASAGHYSNGNLFRLYTGLNCYEFQTRVGESQFANFETGAIKEFTENDREVMFARLRTILESINLIESNKKIIFP